MTFPARTTSQRDPSATTATLDALLDPQLKTALAALDGAAPILAGMANYHLGFVDADFTPVTPSAAIRGKRIRPGIAMLACGAAGGDPRIAAPLAAAVELLHNFTLVHDDIQDQSPSRRHRPTVWTLWGIAQAINAGDAIFAASRVDQDGAVAAWEKHNAVLRERTDWLNGQRFHALKYSGPGTDITIGLADGHEWEGGASTARNGITCNANIPTEEVFTTPHCRRVSGRVVSSKPLSYQGTLIDNIAVRFEEGRIVEASASRGEEVLKKVLDTDEGAARLGEVALVPHSSPISKSGLLFFNTLFDENAASHIALGQCYSKCFVGGDKLTPQQIAGQGGNKSLIHIDWMIGSAETDIDEIHADGRSVPVFRKGEWA